ncbi:hypothetical protein C0075_13920 [Rhizobium sp. KAs_5_22]|uniref:AAA family ATPase n=1 Tax=Ciceribacter selenitireducens TaxID=448181 RepID=UPI00048F390D|nr:AAA family ATPase [Ciceribacter selenitireducens]PPJ46734.1 hypothetical protein C0075_13920 [Rhizobium sp. KAs_5_22]
MQYHVVERRVGDDFVASDTCYLIRNSWDDFGFKTLFEVVLFDDAAERHDLGTIRIMQAGMSSGYVQLPATFDALDESYCSLGSGREYYIALSALTLPLRRRHLGALRDCAADPAIFESFRGQQAMRSSLLRDVSSTDVTRSFPRILRGDASLTPYSFYFDFPGAPGLPGVERCAFQVQPDSRPPTNIHVLIGRNGVGKTRLLAGMADALMDNRNGTIGIHGQFIFNGAEAHPNEFLNLVIVSFSAFDRFDPIPSGHARTDTTLPYYYVGIKAAGAQAAGRATIKSSDDLDGEFRDSINNVAANPQRLERWLDAMRIVSSDPGIGDLDVEALFVSRETAAVAAQISNGFARMSSGHKVVLLTLTRLVEYISDGSLVLMDEPETHLHPPLLGSFVRALSNLLTSRNAVAIVATHSPVVLQEVPASCVSMLMRSGESLRVLRPEDETFAENVSVLTRKVFGLELEQSGFYKLLKEAAPGRNYELVVAQFGDQIGSEGRALTRALVTRED